MPSFACSNFHRAISRRHALKVGGLGLLGLNFAQILNAEPYGTNEKLKARAKSVIFLFQWGGPSHIDMFDMKPDAPEGIRGPHKPISSKADGIQVSEHLPKTAQIMDKVTLIRSMHHTMKNHNSAAYYALSGHAPPSDDQRLRDSLDLFPGYSSVVDKLAPIKGDMPTAVSYPYVISDGSVTPGQHASFLGKDHDPLTVLQDPNSSSFTLPELSLPEGIPFERMQARRELQQLIDKQAHLLEFSAQARGFDGYYDRAIGMLQSPKLREAFNLSAEPQKVRGRAWPHDLWAELPARAATGRGGHEVRHRLFCAEHRWTKHHRRRLGHARVQQHADVSDHRKVSSADDGADPAHAADRSRGARTAGNDAGGMDG